MHVGCLKDASELEDDLLTHLLGTLSLAMDVGVLLGLLLGSARDGTSSLRAFGLGLEDDSEAIEIDRRLVLSHLAPECRDVRGGETVREERVKVRLEVIERKSLLQTTRKVDISLTQVWEGIPNLELDFLEHLLKPGVASESIKPII